MKQFLNEMTSQKKLTDLYKGKSQEFESHNKQLEDLVREMECRLDRLVEEQKLKDNETQEKLQKAQDIREAQDLELEQLRSQLELINSGMLANSTAEQIAYLSETASIASKISNSGKSFTQVYADYTKLQQEMIKEKSEVARLTECLNSIVREFELRVLIKC
jgi:nucleoprotein TPR